MSDNYANRYLDGEGLKVLWGLIKQQINKEINSKSLESLFIGDVEYNGSKEVHIETYTGTYTDI